MHEAWGEIASFHFLHKKLSAGKKNIKMGDNDNEWAAAFVLS